MRRDRERLLDILEAIEKIQKYAAYGRERFNDDELIQTWVVHHIQLIGEAAAGLSEESRKEYPEIPWSAIVNMRNILVHAYFKIDLPEVWNSVENDLPVLKAQLQSMLESETD